MSLILANLPPGIRRIEVRLSDLPRDLDGLKIVQLTDLHLGSYHRHAWLEKRVEQIQALSPDLIVVTGDVLDDLHRAQEILPDLRHLKAPMGVFAVTGNHEYYAGLEGSLTLFQKAGFQTLRNEAKEIAPGLTLAGVDDLTARKQFKGEGNSILNAVKGHTNGSLILLSHSPLEVEKAADLGVDLMLSGHTHAGQIWPFVYLVKLRYPYVSGLYVVNGMKLFVSRGTGLWGPPMRLFRRSEIVLVTLRS